MVFCTYCGQSFTRDEHLERHILTHTNVKPFKCFTCHMSFARRDLLQRHYMVHGRDQNQQEIPAANGMIPKSAGRTPIACSNCAKTKTKCDKKFPCSRCAGRNLRCTLRPTRRASKNANRAGILPEGAVAGVSTVQSADDGSAQQQQQQQQQHSTSDSPQQRPTSNQPISPQSLMAPIPEQLSSQPAAVDAPLTQYNEHPAGGPTPSTSLSPPTQSSNTGFSQTTPVSGYNDFSNLSKDSSDAGSSPDFMIDWSQMQLPLGYDSIMQPQFLLNADMAFDPSLPLSPGQEGILSLMPDVGKGIIHPPLVVPFETPRIDRSFSDLELNHAAPSLQPHRHNSVPSIHFGQSIPAAKGEIPAVIAAQDAWSVFRCTPTLPAFSCPKTAKLNLERLEDTLRNHEGWSTWSPQWDEGDPANSDHLTVMQLHESTRDKLLAITQSFLHKALEIHKGSGRRSSDSDHYTPNSFVSNFVLLPPARVLEYFLRSYANSFEQYYPLTSHGVLDVNELMHCYNDRAASLLVLMMIAQGAMTIPSTDARMLTGGLTEACRISLFDLIERNIILSGDPIVLHAALLFTVQAAWSGDKWQMDIAMGQRGMYFAMLRHSGVLQKTSAPSALGQQSSTEQIWAEWMQNEARSRLIYSWVMVDQELALFHDTAPLFSVTEFAVPIPDADRLWHAKSAAEWSTIFEQVHEFTGGYSSLGSGARPLALQDLFRHFLEDELIPLGIEMTPLQLRLLLHPLQSLICQYSQLLSCFSDSPSLCNNSSEARRVTASSTRSRLEEVQSLLQRWFDLAERYLKANPICPMMQNNLVIFHLISLNAVTKFAEIERLARRENFDGTYPQLMWIHKRCITDVEEAIFHCGQVLRLVRSMSRATRPPWWAGAIYRVALILWTDSLSHKETLAPGSSNAIFPNNGPVPGPSFAIDAVSADHPLLVRYLTKREGVPCVTKRDGSQLTLDRAYPLLQHCIEVIDEGTDTRFSDGIRAKLDRLARG